MAMTRGSKDIFKARSKEDGIVFYSNKIPVVCYESKINEKGEIETKAIPSIVLDMAEYGIIPNEEIKASKKLKLFLKIIITILAISSIVLLGQVSIAMGLIYFYFLVIDDLLNFSKLSFELKLGKYKSVARFHSAEHMVINAYRRYQRVPNMLEVKKESRFEKECGSRKVINRMLICTLVTVLVSYAGFIKLHEYIICFLLIFALDILASKFNIFRFLQILVTNKPTDKELEVALEGIKFFDEMEEGIPEVSCPMELVFLAFDVFDEDDDE